MPKISKDPVKSQKCKATHHSNSPPDPSDLEQLRSQLIKGETIRKDGLLMYRVPKSEYDGPIQPKTLYAPTLKELRQKERELLDLLNRNVEPSDTRLTVNQLFDRWYKLKRGVKQNTFRNYVMVYENHVRHSYLGTKIVATTKKSDLMMFYNNVIDHGVMKVTSLATLHTVLRQIFQIAVDDHIIASNPAEGALDHLIQESHDDTPNRVYALSVAEQSCFLDYLENRCTRNWYRLFTVLLLTGLRAGELTGLQWSDIDFEQNLIFIRHNLVYYPHPKSSGGNPKTFYEMHTTKTDAGVRILPMFKKVKELLLEEKKWQEDEGMHSELTIGDCNDFVFFNRFRRPHTDGTLDAVLHRITRKYNTQLALEREDKPKTPKVMLPQFTNHTLRHTCATRMIEAKSIAPVAVQAYMGHSSLDVTLRLYVRISTEFKKREFGLQSAHVYPNIFDEVLAKPTSGAETDIVSQYLPQSPSAELARYAENYTTATQFAVGQNENI